MTSIAELPETLLRLDCLSPADTALLEDELRAGLTKGPRTTLAFLLDCVVAEALPGYRRAVAYQGEPLDLARAFVYQAARVRVITPAELTRLHATLAGMDELLPLLRLWARNGQAIRKREKAEAAARQLPVLKKAA